MLDFKLLNSQAFLNGELIFRAFLKKLAVISYSFQVPDLLPHPYEKPTQT